jgi:Arm domain-containing DNA-binding protein
MPGSAAGIAVQGFLCNALLPAMPPTAKGKRLSASRKNPAVRLDAKTVSKLSLPTGKSDHIVWDTELRGFGHRLRASGGGKTRQSWIVQYRHGRTRRILLGAAELLSAEQARVAAKKIRAKVALGQDPQDDKAARRQKDEKTLRALVEEYLSFKEPSIRPPTYANLAMYQDRISSRCTAWRSTR